METTLNSSWLIAYGTRFAHAAPTWGWYLAVTEYLTNEQSTMNYEQSS
ncbi:MAG: hypothetical protein F6J89_10795 [Symploca sp. SIO1C4]|uniref:Uncharacterized protein n=1 Tax=Symploca sp. SIO1C4 TaxID=2607765 RepID=A0A6B3N8X8_9CYAN|nr:hypothetical protein [Symploca sp. SIO1C4]